MNEPIIADLDKIILAFCFKGGSCLARITSLISLEHFTEEYRKFAGTIINYYKKYKKIITWPVLETVLKKRNAPIEKILEFQKFFDDVTGFTVDENEFEFYLDEFKKRYWTETLKTALVKKDGIGAVDLIEKEDPVGAWEKIKKAGLQIEIARQSDTVKRGDIKESIETRLEKYYYNQKNPNEAYGLLTGFRKLDEATRGLRGGEVLVIAGRPGSGKSACTLVMGKNAFKAGKNVLVVSIEMPKEQCELRFDASYSGLELDKIELGKLEKDKEEHYKKCLEEIKSKPNFFYIVDRAQCTPLTVVAELEFLIEKLSVRPDLIIIDYIGIMKADEKTKSDNEEQARIIEAVRGIARQYFIPFIVPVQLNRDMTKHRKGTERLSRSDVIGQTADVVIQIDEKDEEDEVAKLDNVLILHVVKNRKGRAGDSFALYCNMATMTIEDKDESAITSLQNIEDVE